MMGKVASIRRVNDQIHVAVSCGPHVAINAHKSSRWIRDVGLKIGDDVEVHLEGRDVDIDKPTRQLSPLTSNK